MTSHFKQLLTPVDLDKKIAILLFGLGLIALLLAAIVLKQVLLVQVSVTVVLASGIYLLLRRRRGGASLAEEDITGATSVPLLHPRPAQLLDIAFWGMFIASLILISQPVYTRPLSFLIIVSVMAAILAIEIFTGKNTAYCLAKVLVIAILLRASVWYQFPGPVGRDPIIEMDYIRRLMAIGHTGRHMGGYAEYPVAHIITAVTSFITGLGLKDAFFVLGIIEVMSLGFLFLVGREFFNEKIGLLSALIMAVSNWHILYGFWLKGQTLGIAWLPILLFFLLAGRQKGRRLPFLIFSILIIFLVISTHTASSAAILVTLVVVWLSSLICRGLPGKEKFEQPVTFTIVLLFVMALLGYSMYVSGWIVYIGVVVRQALSVGILLEEPIMPYRSAGVLTLQKLPVLMLIFLAILGCLTILNLQQLGRKALSRVWLAPAAGGMVIITFLLYYLRELGALAATRWFVFMSLLIALPAAIGLLSMVGRKRWHNLVIPFVTVFLFSGIMTTAYEANITQVVPWVTHTRDAFISSEMAAAETVSQMANLAPGQTPQGKTKIYTDFLYGILLESEFQMPQAKLVDASPIFKEESAEYNGILLLRSVVTDMVLTTYEAGHLYSRVAPSHYQSLIDDRQAILIYDNGVVKALKKIKTVLPEMR